MTRPNGSGREIGNRVARAAGAARPSRRRHLAEILDAGAEQGAHLGLEARDLLGILSLPASLISSPGSRGAGRARRPFSAAIRPRNRTYSPLESPACSDRGRAHSGSSRATEGRRPGCAATARRGRRTAGGGGDLVVDAPVLACQGLHLWHPGVGRASASSAAASAPEWSLDVELVGRTMQASACSSAGFDCPMRSDGGSGCGDTSSRGCATRRTRTASRHGLRSTSPSASNATTRSMPPYPCGGTANQHGAMIATRRKSVDTGHSYLRRCSRSSTATGSSCATTWGTSRGRRRPLLRRHSPAVRAGACARRAAAEAVLVGPARPRVDGRASPSTTWARRRQPSPGSAAVERAFRAAE